MIESPSVSDSSLDASESFTFSATVRNQGAGRAAATTLRYYRSTNATISRTDTEVGTDAVGGLAASAASVESISLTAPSSAGTYYYGACVGSVSGESDTTNNCSSAVRVTVGGSGGGDPDLVIESPSVSDSSLDASESFTFSATVRNQGAGRAAATTLRYYRSTNATISRTDTEVGTDAVGGLAASAASVESISLTAPSSAGTYYYGACVGSVSEESDTTNNCSSAVRVTVGGDAAVTLEITQCSGRVITFGSVLVTIRGTVQAHRSVTSAYVTGTANDRHVRRVPLGSISAGDSENFTMIGTITTFASTLRCSVLVESRELR